MLVTEEKMQAYARQLYLDEKSEATIKKYAATLQDLGEFLNGRDLTKERLLLYRRYLLEKHTAQTVNGALSAIHSFMKYYNCENECVKFLKVQRRPFVDKSKVLSRTEYKRLLDTAKREGKERLYYVMLTLGGTGIRISELRYITVEAVLAGKANVSLKGKNRVILLQKELCKKLKNYIKKNHYKSGCVFRTRNGNPLDRSNIFHEMKALCSTANVRAEKVFPHNFRHLFARMFYEVEKNLAHLADVLGHSRIETTRIYVAVSEAEHEQTLSRMRLIL